MSSKFNKLKPHTEGILLALFVLSAILSAADITTDLLTGGTIGHVLTEAVLLMLALAGTVVAARWLQAALATAKHEQQRAAKLETQLAETHAKALRWRTEAEDLMRGLGVAIGEQFERWGLTNAEAETALLMLKGLAHKEVASVRGVSVASARQQAHAVYRKAGLSGRHELTAFFLEDLMLPQRTDDT